jgi:hypothetical protein
MLVTEGTDCIPLGKVAATAEVMQTRADPFAAWSVDEADYQHGDGSTRVKICCDPK